MEWQPIETAPRESVRILVVSSGRVYCVRWKEEAEHGQTSEKGPGWQLFQCEDSFYSVALEKDEPTHWMPLPEPPQK